MNNHQAILKEFKRLGLSEGEGMGLLEGVISDNCIRIWDIAREDIPNALCRLRGMKKISKTN